MKDSLACAPVVESIDIFNSLSSVTGKDWIKKTLLHVVMLGDEAQWSFYQLEAQLRGRDADIVELFILETIKTCDKILG